MNAPLPAERWLPVPEFPRYHVSDLGRVKGPKQNLLATAVGGRAKNYIRVMLHRHSRHNVRHVRKHAYVHHLVAEAFLGPRPLGLEVCHLNDDGFDNRLVNIVYGTPEENLLDKHVAEWLRANTALEPAPF